MVPAVAVLTMQMYIGGDMTLGADAIEPDCLSKENRKLGADSHSSPITSVESAPSKELLPGRERRQPGNTEQFLPVARLRSGVTSLTIACKRPPIASARASLCAVKAVWKHVETPLGIQVPTEPLGRSIVDHSTV